MDQIRDALALVAKRLPLLLEQVLPPAVLTQTDAQGHMGRTRMEDHGQTPCDSPNGPFWPTASQVVAVGQATATRVVVPGTTRAVRGIPSVMGATTP